MALDNVREGISGWFEDDDNNDAEILSTPFWVKDDRVSDGVECSIEDGLTLCNHSHSTAAYLKIPYPETTTHSDGIRRVQRATTPPPSVLALRDLPDIFGEHPNNGFKLKCDCLRSYPSSEIRDAVTDACAQRKCDDESTRNIVDKLDRAATIELTANYSSFDTFCKLHRKIIEYAHKDEIFTDVEKSCITTAIDYAVDTAKEQDFDPYDGLPEQPYDGLPEQTPGILKIEMLPNEGGHALYALCYRLRHDDGVLVKIVNTMNNVKTADGRTPHGEPFRLDDDDEVPNFVLPACYYFTPQAFRDYVARVGSHEKLAECGPSMGEQYDVIYPSDQISGVQHVAAAKTDEYMLQKVDNCAVFAFNTSLRLAVGRARSEWGRFEDYFTCMAVTAMKIRLDCVRDQCSKRVLKVLDSEYEDLVYHLLDRAGHKGDIAMVLTLLFRTRAPPDADRMLRNALKQENPAMIDALVEAGGKFDTELLHSALWTAANENYVNMVAVLIKAGGKLTDDEYCEFLFRAVKEEHTFMRNTLARAWACEDEEKAREFVDDAEKQVALIEKVAQEVLDRAMDWYSPNAQWHSDFWHPFPCPILNRPLVDPVVGPDGYLYERNALEAWPSNRSPKTNLPW